MNTAIIITLVICGTLIGLALIGLIAGRQKTNTPLSKEEAELAKVIFNGFSENLKETLPKAGGNNDGTKPETKGRT